MAEIRKWTGRILIGFQRLPLEASEAINSLSEKLGKPRLGFSDRLRRINLPHHSAGRRLYYQPPGRERADPDSRTSAAVECDNGSVQRTAGVHNASVNRQHQARVCYGS